MMTNVDLEKKKTTKRTKKMGVNKEDKTKMKT